MKDFPSICLDGLLLFYYRLFSICIAILYLGRTSEGCKVMKIEQGSEQVIRVKGGYLANTQQMEKVCVYTGCCEKTACENRTENRRCDEKCIKNYKITFNDICCIFSLLSKAGSFLKPIAVKFSLAHHALNTMK